MAIHLSRGETYLQPGYFDTPAQFFTTQATDTNGAIVRTPVAAFRCFANVSPFQAFEQREGAREVGQIWVIVSLRYISSQTPTEGMTLTLSGPAWQGLTFEVMGVVHVDGTRRKYELTCRSVK